MDLFKQIKSLSFVILCGINFCFSADKINTLTFKDIAKNTILILKYNYDTHGTLINREALAPDSFFFRVITTKTEIDNSITESSVNFDQQPWGTIKYNKGTDRTTYSVYDEFGEVIFSGSWNSISENQTHYDISDDEGKIIAKLDYVYVNGVLSSVNVSNANSVLTHTITTNYENTSTIKNFLTRKNATLRILNSGKISLQFTSYEQTRVECSLMDLKGKLITKLVNQQVSKGPYNVIMDLQKNRVGSQAALLKVNIGNSSQVYKLYMNNSGKYYTQDISNFSTRNLKRTESAIVTKVNDFSTWISPITILELLLRNGDVEIPSHPIYRSPGPIVASKDKTLLYVAEETAKRIGIISIAQKSVIGEILLPNQPTGLVLSKDGSRLYVTCASGIWPIGMLYYIDIATKSIINAVEVGHSARNPVLSPDETELYVLNQFEDKVSFVNVQQGKVKNSVSLIREPYSAALTPDGKMLVVANSLPRAPANDPDTNIYTNKTASYVSFINTQTKQVVDSVKLPMGSHSLFGTTISPDGKYAFITHLTGFTRVVAEQPISGWIHTNNCSIIDLTKTRPTLTDIVTLDEMTQGMANPWSVFFTDDGKYLNVLHAGSSNISSMDYSTLLTKIGTQDKFYYQFNKLNSFRKMFYLKGKGSRYAVPINHSLYVSNYFSDSIEIIDIDSNTNLASSGISLASPKPLSRIREGESFFYDATLCLQRWQSCASCHPFTRSNTLNWILRIGNNAPKNARSTLYSYYTPPMHWTGAQKFSSVNSIENGIRFKLFLEPEPIQVGSINTFFKTLRPIPSPSLHKGKLTVSGEKGRLLYHSNKVDCNNCHKGPLYFSNEQTPSFIADNDDPTTSWDVPSLNECWRTAPYGHLGSVVGLADIIKHPGHSMSLNKLSNQEIQDLVTYISSL